MEVNGIAHIFLTAPNYERSRDFYRKLLPFLGLPAVRRHGSRLCGAAPSDAVPRPGHEHFDTVRSYA